MSAPKLRFPEFEGKWENTLLDRVTTRKSGHTPNKAIEDYWNGGIKWVSLTDSSSLDQGMIWETAKEISYKGVENSSAVLLPPHTVVMSRDAGVGKSAVIGTEMAVSQHFIAWICDGPGQLQHWFLYHWLQIKKAYFERQAVGSTIKTIGLPLFKKLKIDHPTLSEQKKIAAFFGVVDDKIAALLGRQAGLERYKRGLMQALFSQGLRFTKPDGTPFPDWEYMILGDIFDYEQPTKYIVENTNYDDAFPTPVLTAGKKFILGYTQEQHSIFDSPLPVIIFDDFTTASKYVDFPFKVKSSAMKILKPKSINRFVTLYFDLLQSIQFVVGDHKRHWISEFQHMEVPFPHPDEQQKIADALSAMDTKIRAVAGQVAQMQTFKKGLMQQMFV